MNFSSPFLALATLAEGVTDRWDSPGLVLAKLGAIALLVLLNGFFVAAEFALVKIRMSQLEALADEGNTRAAKAQTVAGDLDAYLVGLPTRDHAGEPRPGLGGRTVSRADSAAAFYA